MVAGLFTQADAAVLAAIFTTLGAIIVALITAGVLGKRVRRVQSEMQPNGGATMRDAIDRVDKCSQELEARMNGSIVPALHSHDARLAKVETVMEENAAGIRALLRAAGIDRGDA